MERLRTKARSLVKAAGPLSVVLGAAMTIMTAVLLAAEANEVLGLSWQTLQAFGLALFAVGGAAVILRHEEHFRKLNDYLGNEHARSLWKDGIPATQDNYLNYIRRGDIGIVRRFWDAEIVNVRGSGGRTDLHMAAQGGHAKIADEVIQRGCPPHLPDDRGMTPLMLAAQYGQTSTVQVLLDYDCGLEQRVPDIGVSALFIAVANNKPAIVQDLLDHGADVDAVDRDNRTPLMAALLRGRWGISLTLIEQGADVNAIDRYGAQPMDYALRRREAGDVPEQVLDRLRHLGAERGDPPVEPVGGSGFSAPGEIRAEWERRASE